MVASAALRAFAHRCKQNTIHTSSASRFGVANAHALFLRAVGVVGVGWVVHWVGFVGWGFGEAKIRKFWGIDNGIDNIIYTNIV